MQDKQIILFVTMNFIIFTYVSLGISISASAMEAPVIAAPPAIRNKQSLNRILPLKEMAIAQVATSVACLVLKSYMNYALAHRYQPIKKVTEIIGPLPNSYEKFDQATYQALKQLSCMLPHELFEKIAFAFVLQIACSKVRPKAKSSMFGVIYEYLITHNPPESLQNIHENFYFIIHLPVNIHHIENLFKYEVPDQEKKRKISLLHLAVFRSNFDAFRYLMYYGADIDVPDGEGVTPLNWALSQALHGTSDDIKNIMFYTILLFRPNPQLINYKSPISAMGAARMAADPTYAHALFDLVESNEKKVAQNEDHEEFKLDDSACHSFILQECKTERKEILWRCLKLERKFLKMWEKHVLAVCLYLKGESIASALQAINDVHKNLSLSCLVYLAINSCDLEALDSLFFHSPDIVMECLKSNSFDIPCAYSKALTKKLQCIGLVFNKSYLIRAAHLGCLETVQEYITCKSTASQVASGLEEALKVALEREHDEVALFLLRKTPEEMHASLQKKFFTYICQAAQHGLLQTCAWLINKGALQKKWVVDETFFNEENVADCVNFRFGIAREHFYNFKLDETIEEERLHPLVIAAHYGHMTIVEALAHVTDINHKCFNGRTALHRAARSGHTDIVSYLLKMGATCDCKDNGELTPLHLALMLGHAPVVRVLLQAGAEREKPFLVRGSAFTPLQFACASGFIPLVRALLDNDVLLENYTSPAFSNFIQDNPYVRKKVAADIIALIESKKSKNS